MSGHHYFILKIVNTLQKLDYLALAFLLPIVKESNRQVRPK